MRKNTSADILDKETSRHIFKYFGGLGYRNCDLARLMNVDPSVVSKITSGERRLTLKHVKKMAKNLNQLLPIFILSTFPAPPPGHKDYRLYCEIRESYLESCIARVELAALKKLENLRKKQSKKKAKKKSG